MYTAQLWQRDRVTHASIHLVKWYVNIGCICDTPGGLYG